MNREHSVILALLVRVKGNLLIVIRNNHYPAHFLFGKMASITELCDKLSQVAKW